MIEGVIGKGLKKTKKKPKNGLLLLKCFIDSFCIDLYSDFCGIQIIYIVKPKTVNEIF